MSYDALKSLEKRNNFLKSLLLHEKLKHGVIPLNYLEKYFLNIIWEYKICGSLLKSADNVGINQKLVMDWYVQGQLKNPTFRGFYLAITNINRNIEPENDEDFPACELNHNEEVFEGDYVISPYGDGWSYKTYVDGEKIFLISDNLESLKTKVTDRHLPID